MRPAKRLAHGLVIGISMFICLASTPANPADFPNYSILHNFMGGTGDGSTPWYGAPVLSGSSLYGMTGGGGKYTICGTLYRINTDGTGYQVLHWFDMDDPNDGWAPHGGLTLSGSTLYGCTRIGGPGGGGTVFKMNTNGSGYQQLGHFVYPGQANPVGAPLIAGSTL
jgi:uncharacterized repeat protein (TIGR03803 family)